MKAMKKAPPEPSLLERLHAMRAELDEFIMAETMKLKNSRDGASQPIFDLRHMLTKGETCICRAAARLLGDPDA